MFDTVVIEDASDTLEPLRAMGDEAPEEDIEEVIAIVEGCALQYLVERRYGAGASLSSEERAAALVLVHELSEHPLALELASAYITAKEMTIHDYSLLFRSRQKEQQSNPLCLATQITGQINLEALSEEYCEAQPVLHLAASLAPAPLPFEIIRATMGNKEIDAEDSALLECLTDYALISVDHVSETIRFSPVLAGLCRTTRPGTDNEWTIKAIETVTLALPPADTAYRARWERFMPHVMTLAGWVLTFGCPTESAAFLLTHTADYLHARECYSQIEPLRVKALEIDRSLLPENPARIARNLQGLGDLYMLQGRTEKAAPLLAEASAIRSSLS